MPRKNQCVMKKTAVQSVFKEGAFGYAFKNGKFYAFNKRSVLVLKAWPDPRSWLKRRSHDWKSTRMHADRFLSSALFAAGEETVLPKRTLLLHPEHELVGTSAEWLEGQAHNRELQDAIEISNRKRMAVYFDLIPPVVRRELLRYRDRRWHLLNLFARCPGALDLSRSNPALAYALASNWVFHKPMVRLPVRAARSLVNRKQREIMKWLRFPPREPVRRILARIPPECVTIGNLLHLRRAVRRKAVVKLLVHVRRINSGVIRLVGEPVGMEMLTTGFLNEVGQDRERDVKFVALLETYRDTQRMLRIIHSSSERLEPFDSLQRLQAVHDKCALVFQNNLSVLKEIEALPPVFPEPPFAGNETIVPICVPADLYAEGKEMHHCVFSYGRQIAEGHEYIYRVIQPVRGTLSVLQRDKVWVGGPFVEACNKRVPDEVREHVLRTLFQTARGSTFVAEENQTAPAAQMRIGLMHQSGQGVRKDAETAVRWFRRAAEQGLASAQNMLGWIYSHGTEAPLDDVEALMWFRKAAEQGDAQAQNNLGWMIQNGRGCPPSDTEALGWYRMSAEQDFVRGQFHYGLMLRDGCGTRKNLTLAAKFISCAAQRGDAEAQWEWAQMLEIGLGIPRCIDQAQQWYAKAAEKGHALAKTKARELENSLSMCAVKGR